MGLIKLGFWSSAFLLITKYGFPKFSVQDSIKDDPKAIALMVGCIAIAIALISETCRSIKMGNKT